MRPTQSCCCCSVAKSRMILCDPWTIACQALLFSIIFWSLLKFVSIESVMLFNHLILFHSLLLLPSIFPASGSFPMSRLFTSGGQSIGASAPVSVLPMNIQGWFPLGLTGLTSLKLKGLSRVFSSTTNQKKDHSLLYSPTLTSLQDYWKNSSFDNTDLCQKSDVSAFKYQSKENK